MCHTVELTLGRSFSTGLPSTYAHRKGVLPSIASTSMQADKNQPALPCRLRSTAPRCPQVQFRRKAQSH